MTFEPCEVTATFTRKGEARPTEILWRGDLQQIIETGRRWTEEDGQHILARTADNRVFELLYNGARWQAKSVSQPPHLA